MEQTIYTHSFATPYGELLLGVFEQKLVLCDWKYRKQRKKIDERIQHTLQANYQPMVTATAQETVNQLNEYFQGSRSSFDVPIKLLGTDFQKKVWKELTSVPYGKTVSYLTLSKQLGDEQLVRAVANANGANAISILIPCHRVVGSNGQLVGYAGGLSAKKQLLQLEAGVQQMKLFQSED